MWNWCNDFQDYGNIYIFNVSLKIVHAMNILKHEILNSSVNPTRTSMDLQKSKQSSTHKTTEWNLKKISEKYIYYPLST